MALNTIDLVLLPLCQAVVMVFPELQVLIEGISANRLQYHLLFEPVPIVGVANRQSMEFLVEPPLEIQQQINEQPEPKKPKKVSMQRLPLVSQLSFAHPAKKVQSKRKTGLFPPAHEPFRKPADTLFTPQPISKRASDTGSKRVAPAFPPAYERKPEKQISELPLPELPPVSQSKSKLTPPRSFRVTVMDIKDPIHSTSPRGVVKKTFFSSTNLAQESEAPVKISDVTTHHSYANSQRVAHGKLRPLDWHAPPL